MEKGGGSVKALHKRHTADPLPNTTLSVAGTCDVAPCALTREEEKELPEHDGLHLVEDSNMAAGAVAGHDRGEGRQSRPGRPREQLEVDDGVREGREQQRRPRHEPELLRPRARRPIRGGAAKGVGVDGEEGGEGKGSARGLEQAASQAAPRQQRRDQQRCRARQHLGQKGDEGRRLVGDPGFTQHGAHRGEPFSWDAFFFFNAPSSYQTRRDPPGRRSL